MRMPGQNVQIRPEGAGPGAWTNRAISPRGTKGHGCRLADPEAHDGGATKCPFDTIGSTGHVARQLCRRK